MQVEKKAKKQKTKKEDLSSEKEKKEDSSSTVTEKEAPQVSNERFYEVNKSLKSLFEKSSEVDVSVLVCV